MEKLNTYSVYSHTNILNGKCYIGLTKNKPEYRWKKGKDYKSCTAFNRAILKYGWDCFDHEIIASNLSAEEAEQIEKEMIILWNTSAPNGYNLTSGGENKKIISDETKQKIREKALGRIVSDETRAKLSKIHKGRVFSEETLEKLRVVNTGSLNPNFGKKALEETRLKMHNTRVGALNSRALAINQFSLEGEFIKKWDYIKQAAIELGIQSTSIGSVCKGKRNKAGGFKWEYVND